MKIWQTIMIMRDESKQVQDAVYEAITKGWVPTAINPLLDLAYLVLKIFIYLSISIILIYLHYYF